MCPDDHDDLLPRAERAMPVYFEQLDRGDLIQIMYDHRSTFSGVQQNSNGSVYNRDDTYMSSSVHVVLNKYRQDYVAIYPLLGYTVPILNSKLKVTTHRPDHLGKNSIGFGRVVLVSKCITVRYVRRLVSSEVVSLAMIIAPDHLPKISDAADDAYYKSNLTNWITELIIKQIQPAYNRKIQNAFSILGFFILNSQLPEIAEL